MLAAIEFEDVFMSRSHSGFAHLKLAACVAMLAAVVFGYLLIGPF